MEKERYASVYTIPEKNEELILMCTRWKRTETLDCAFDRETLYKK